MQCRYHAGDALIAERDEHTPAHHRLLLGDLVGECHVQRDWQCYITKGGHDDKERLYGKQKTTASRGTGLSYSSGVFAAGGFNPRNFIAICKSFHASFFWRGSRSRYAGWYVTN